jgi:hypothetical protein
MKPCGGHLPLFQGIFLKGLDEAKLMSALKARHSRSSVDFSLVCTDRPQARDFTKLLQNLEF